jgi:hypothetical protein
MTGIFKINNNEVFGSDGTFSGTIGSGATGFTGIKNIDNWHLNGNITHSVDPIAYSLYTRASSSSGGANLGTGMTLVDQSGGIFLFPTTGIWKIESSFQHSRSGDSRFVFTRAKLSTTGKSGSFSTIAEGAAFIQYTSSGSTHAMTSSHAIVDVTTAGDTGSSFAIGFQISAAGSITTLGSTSKMKSYITFTRLGDT